jgi:amino acid adenylation domain-containing protein
MTFTVSDLHQPRAKEMVCFPASFAQQRLWFIDHLTPGTATYNLPSALRVRGKLDVEVLGRTLQEVVRRHETLRTRFVAVGGEPQQVIEGETNVQLPVLDLTGVAGEEEREAEAMRLARQEAQNPFNLKQAPLFRGKLLRLGKQDHVLLFTMHHIISDAWSMGVLIEEVSVLYGAFSLGQPSPLPELPIQYVDYSEWQRGWLKGEVLEQQLGYWKQQLTGLSPLLLPTDRPRPAVQRQGGSTCEWGVEFNVTQQLKRMAQVQGASLFMVLVAALQTLLYRYSGQEDIAIGAPIAGRESSETENLIGFFINTLVLRVDLSGGPSFLELLGRVKEVTLEAYAHREIPFQKLVGVVAPERNLGNTPLFQVIITLQNAPQADLRLGTAVLEPLGNVHDGTSKFDLSLLQAEEESGKLSGSMEYDTDLFEFATIQRMMRHYSCLLASILAAPNTPLQSLAILGPEERRMLLWDFNATVAPIAEKTVIGMFEEQVDRTPEATAVRCEGASLTYSELDQRANQLGHYLKQMGVGPEVRVGICLERSLEMIVTLLGVLKAGGAYVPLDPRYPQERLQFMVEDSQSAVLISQRTVENRFSQTQIELIFWEDVCNAVERCNRERVESGVIVDNLAYLIYTSGSTGRPKGAMVTHRNVVRLMKCTEPWFGFNEQDVWTMFHSYAFDFSVWELWGALLYGGRLEVVPYWVSRSPEAFYGLVKERGVTVLNQTPSAFQQFSREDKARGAGHQELKLRQVIFGGEALEMSSLRPWFERHGDETPQMVNMYGITETTVHVTYKVLRKETVQGNASVVGVRIPDLQLYILQEMDLVPMGVAGEIYVGGAGLARGYWKRPELTAERFVPHPFSERGGERLYRTGDWGRYRTDGDVEYLGRMDQQVKIRGHRIELGEIQAALESHEAVKQAVVIVREDQPGEKRLVVYVVQREENGEGVLDLGRMRNYLQTRLPEYMVPGALVVLETMPLTAHGKLDRTALPRPEWSGDEKKYVAPRNVVEEQLSRIWSEILRVERVGIRDNFFELGGDSILSIQILARAREAGLKIELPHLFTYQTIERLAQAVSSIKKEERGQEETEPFSLIIEEDRRKLPEDVEDAYPVSRLQAGMLFHSQFRPEESLYHNVASYRLQIGLDMKALRRAVRRMVERHEVLRTAFHLSGYSEPLQLVYRSAEVEVGIRDLSGLSEEEQEGEIRGWQEEEKRRFFDVSRPGLLRFQVLKRSEEQFEFGMTEHHVILDGWSVASLLTELFGCYLGELKGEEWKMEELGSSFKEFVALEREAMRSEETRRYWEKQLEDVSAPEMPWAGREAVGGRGRGSVEVEIREELSAGLKALAQKMGVSLKTVLLAGHMRVLGMLSSGERDVITGLVSNGRAESRDGERVLGLFLNTVPFRMGLRGGQWADLVRETAVVEGGLLAHRRYPLAELQEQRGVGGLFDVTFNFTNFHVYRKLDDFGLQVLNVVGFAETNFPLVVDFGVWGLSSQVHLNLAFARGLITENQIEAIAQYYRTTLHAMVARPEARYETTMLLTEREQQQLLIEWNMRRVRYREVCVHELFEEQVARTPASVALEFKNEELTYTELNRRTNQIAHYLKNIGVGPEVLVGICVERSLQMVVGLLGVLKAGGAYVPLDPAYPAERLKYMMQNAGINVLLTQQEILSQLPETTGTKIVVLDEQWQQIAFESDRNPAVTSEPDNLAYLIYTSGSTGMPKGVAISHRALSNHMQWMQQEFNFCSTDRILQKTPMSFDASVWEFYAPLLNGGQLVMLEPGAHRDSVELSKKIVEGGITVVQMVPTLMNAVIAAGGLRAKAGQLRLAACGGEELRADLAEQIWEEIPGVEVVNLYGPTEATIDASYWRGRSWQKPGSLPIGKPINNLNLYVLNQHMQPVPMEVTGEIYIGGTGLARGYWQRPDLTAERFVPNPLSAEDGERLYRTGDLARWSRDGDLQFVGRKDHQVKVRGYRIELGEIEATLLEHGPVQEAVAIVREDALGDKRLVAYYTATTKVEPEVLHRHLSEKLPAYMVPAAYVWLEKLPLMPNGKLDRKALPVPEGDVYPSRDYEPPQGEMENLLAEIWADLLKIEGLGRRDNFFELGGHSLLALQLVARIRESFKVEIPIRALFEAPTLGKMAEHIAGGTVQRPQLSPVLVSMQPHGTRTPLFFVHAVGGQVMAYAELSRELGLEQPFYGLQAPLADFFRGSDASIARMATLYIREIRTVQPYGPYLLGGWSMGGLVAWEMAQQLVTQGETIRLLSLIDTASSSEYRKESDKAADASMLARFAIDMSRLVGKDPRPLTEQFLWLTPQDQWKMVQEALTSYGVLSLATAHAEMAALLDIFTRNFLAGGNYIARPINQQVVFFRASETPEHLVEPWTPLAVGGIHFHSVPGNHFTILAQPAVRIIADLLQEYILNADV